MYREQIIKMTPRTLTRQFLHINIHIYWLHRIIFRVLYSLSNGAFNPRAAFGKKVIYIIEMMEAYARTTVKGI